MKRNFIYKIFIGLLILLTLLTINPAQIHAEGLAVGNSIGSTDSMSSGNFGGPSMYRTGWLCVLTDSSGYRTLNSQVVFFPYLNTDSYGICNGTITTEFFETSLTGVITGSYLNSVPCFQGSVPGGPILKSYLLQQCEDPTYVNNAMMVAEKYLGVPVAEINKAIGNGQEIFLQYSPIYWCRRQGQTKQDKGEFWISNSYTWAQVNPAPSWIAVATHRNFPQASALEYPWFGLGCVSEFKQPGEYWQVGEWQANGLGIGAIKISNSYQIVQVIETPSGNQTRYLTSDSKYTIPDKIGNAVIQPDSGFVSKEHTKTNSASASYSEVKAGCTQIGGLVSGGTFDFLSRQGSTALFLHYKGSEIIETKSDTDLMAFELMVRVPGEKESSVNEKRTDKSIQHHSFSDMQNRVESWQNEHVYEKELEKQVEVERSLAKDHSYILDQNHGDFDTGNGIWQLYRGEYIDQWVIYPELSGKIWEVTDVIDPNYAYYLCRSHLEGLTLVADRENSGTAGLYLSKTKPFEVGYNGKYGAEQGINTTKTWTDLAPYNYTYVPRWANGTGAYIVVDRYTREKLPHTDSCYGDSPDTEAVELDAFICEEEHYTPWEYVGQPKFTAPASQFYILTGTYGTHNIDKYQSQETSTGISGHAGDASTGKSGVDLSGKFVKGSDFDYTGRISKAVHGSQFPETYRLYGEIPMLFWKQENIYEYDMMSAQTAFVWSSFERSIKPSLVHGFKTEISGSGVLEGVGSLPTASSGHTAQTVEAQSSATDLGLTYMGCTFNIGTTNHYYFDFYSLGFTTEDERSEGINANNEWGNTHSSVKAAHDTYVNSVLAGTQQEIIWELTFKPSGKKLYYTMLTDTQNIVNQPQSEKVGDYDLWWKNNSFADNGTDYSGFYDSGVAESYLNLRELYDGTLINNGESHEGQVNNSEQAQIKDVVDYTSGSYEEYTNYENWYDEQSYYRFEVEKWHTRVEMDMLSCSDKVDYNILTQNIISNYLNQSDFVECRFYARLWRDTDAPYTDGYCSWPSEKTFRVDKIQNVDFTVINQSTEDLKK